MELNVTNKDSNIYNLESRMEPNACKLESKIELKYDTLEFGGKTIYAGSGKCEHTWRKKFME